jgi:hypothetical protein
MNAKNWAVLLPRGLRRVVGGVVTTLLLMPVPAMAITYLGSWSATFTQTGGPTPPKPTFTDVPNFNGNPQNDQLLVDMGEYQGSTATATSTIQLTRQVSIPKTQRIEFDDGFSGLFSQAGYSATVTVKDSNGNIIVTPINVTKSTTSKTFIELQDSNNVTQSIAGSAKNYTLVVTVTHNTSNKVGGWKHNPPHKSAHEFDFQGQ